MVKHEGICFWVVTGLFVLGAVDTGKAFKIRSVPSANNNGSGDSGVQIKAGGDDEIVEWLSLDDYNSYEDYTDQDGSMKPWNPAISVFGRTEESEMKNGTKDWDLEDEYDWSVAEEDLEDDKGRVSEQEIVVNVMDSSDSTENEDDNGWWGSSNDNDSLLENNARFGQVRPSKKGTS